LAGFVATQAERDALAQAARALRPGTALRVTVGDELVQRAREFLADPGIQPRYAGAGRLQLAGRPQQLTEAAELDRRLAQLRADLGQAVLLQDGLDRSQLRVAAAEPVVHPLPVRIAEVHADEPAHFRDADGARYFEGARLADGAEVVRIRADEILFRRHGREIRYAVVE
jgi:type III secretion protein D